MPNVPPGRKLFLRFSYHIITSDQNYGLRDYLDRFEVLFNNPPPVVRDMNQRYQFGCQYVYDLLRQDARIEVPVQRYNAGDSIKVDFRLYNDDVDQMYNTYVYLDDVRLQFQQAAP
jgi:hypothetical protein